MMLHSQAGVEFRHPVLTDGQQHAVMGLSSSKKKKKKKKRRGGGGEGG